MRTTCEVCGRKLKERPKTVGGQERKTCDYECRLYKSLKKKISKKRITA